MSTRPVAPFQELFTSKLAPLDQEVSPPEPLAQISETQPPESTTFAQEEQTSGQTEWVTSPGFQLPTPGVLTQQGQPPLSAEVAQLFTTAVLVMTPLPPISTILSPVLE